jgi:hypothetical protein
MEEKNEKKGGFCRGLLFDDPVDAVCRRRPAKHD